MNKLPLLLLSTALLAACGTAAGSGGSASLRGTSHLGGVQLSQRTNADAELDVNRVNPPITKGARRAPVAPAHPQTTAPKLVQPPVPVDRCNGGIGTGFGAGNGSSTGGKRQLPACMVE
jgi:hypothetical protein